MLFAFPLIFKMVIFQQNLQTIYLFKNTRFLYLWCIVSTHFVPEEHILYFATKFNQLCGYQAKIFSQNVRNCFYAEISYLGPSLPTFKTLSTFLWKLSILLKNLTILYIYICVLSICIQIFYNSCHKYNILENAFARVNAFVISACTRSQKYLFKQNL